MTKARRRGRRPKSSSNAKLRKRIPRAAKKNNDKKTNPANKVFPHSSDPPNNQTLQSGPSAKPGSLQNGAAQVEDPPAAQKDWDPAKLTAILEHINNYHSSVPLPLVEMPTLKDFLDSNELLEDNPASEIIELFLTTYTEDQKKLLSTSSNNDSPSDSNAIPQGQDASKVANEESNTITEETSQDEHTSDDLDPTKANEMEVDSANQQSATGNDPPPSESSENKKQDQDNSIKPPSPSTSRQTYKDMLLSPTVLVDPTPSDSSFLTFKHLAESGLQDAFSDDDTVAGRNKKKYLQSRYSLMAFITKADVEGSDEDAPILVIRRINAMLRSLTNKVPQVRVGPWTATKENISKRDLLKSFPEDVDIVEKYVYGFNRFLSGGQRAYVRIQLFYRQTTNVSEITSIISTFRQP